MINPSLFFRQCESLDWSDCLVVLLLAATHFRKIGHARLIKGCFSFSQCFQAGIFSSLSPPPPIATSPLPLTRPISSSLQEVLTWRFREQIARPKKTPALQANWWLKNHVWMVFTVTSSNCKDKSSQVLRILIILHQVEDKQKINLCRSFHSHSILFSS